MIIELKKGAQTIAVCSSFLVQVTRGGHNRSHGEHNRSLAGHKCAHADHNEFYAGHNQMDGRFYSKKCLESEVQ